MYLFDVNSESGESTPRKSVPPGAGNRPSTNATLQKSATSAPESAPYPQARPVLEVLIGRYGGPWVRAAELPGLFASWDLAHRCTKAGWLNPVMRGRRRTIYRLSDIAACIERIEAGERPPARGAR